MRNMHGKKNTRLYSIHQTMKRRCYKSNATNYKNYGGRGIGICEEWLNDFMSFYNWAISNGYSDKLTIDRINSNGNYTPDNCAWVTIKEQQNNRNNNRIVEYEGSKYTLSKFCEKFDLPYAKTRQRLSRDNWSIEECIIGKRPYKKRKGS